MKLEQIYEEISKDIPINRMDLGGEAVKNSSLFVKYIRLYSDAKLKVEILENRKKALLGAKRDYYTGNAPADAYKEKPFDVRVKTESAIKQYIENDQEVIAANEAIILENQKVEILYATLDHIKSRNYSVKSAIDMTKFEAGV